MSVKEEPSGRRSIQVEVEVPGTPEEVWQAIASGPGISSWFVPTQLDGRTGGTVTCSFGPGMDASSTIQEWEPPHRFKDEHPIGPDAPTMATEWIVEARSGGNCVVRVVHSFFASTDDWDDQLTGVESGWPTFFRILRLYLTKFRGEPGFTFLTNAMTAKSGGWEKLTTSLDLGGAIEGQPWKSPPGVPVATGTVHWAGDGKPAVLVQLDQPMPGVAFLNACPMGEQVWLSVYVYLYGSQAKTIAPREEPLWQDWMKGQFPAA
jgi:uncharacterized protein YndB with AHSA1/START domain